MIIAKALLAFALAFLAESMVEYLLAVPLSFLVKRWPIVEQLQIKLYAALGVGVLMAFQYDLDLIFEGFGYTAHWVGFGVLLTGLGLGRGANWLHDFWTTYLSPQS